MCNDLAFKNLILEGDAQAIINAVNKAEEDSSWIS